MPNPKKIFLITYGASSPNLTHEMLNDEGIIVDECYTLEQRDLKYSLLNVPNRIRVDNMTIRFRNIKEKHNVILQEIVGYDAITGYYGMNNELEEHPGFKLMVKHISTMSAWMRSGEFSTNSKGIFWTFIPDQDLSAMNRAQLLKWAKHHKKETIEVKRKLDETEEEIGVLQVENEDHQNEIMELRESNKRLRAKVDALRTLYRPC
jgi:hypothetical protein